MSGAVKVRARGGLQAGQALPAGWRWVRLGDVCTLAGDSIDPQKYADEKFAHYSIPAYDDGRRPVIERGKEILSNKILFNVSLPVPLLSEQQRIAAILTEQMAAVERARQAAEERLKTIRALPLALMRSTFEAPTASRWETKRLGDVLIPHKETIHPGDRKSGTATFVGLEHLEPHTGRRLGSVPLDLARLTGRKPTFRRGQIVYGYLRPYLNKVWVAEFDGCSSVDQFAYEVRSDIADAGFVAWFMRSPTYLRRSAVMATTGQLPRIGTEEIAAVKIGLPSLPEQKRISSQLSAQMSAVEQARQAAAAELASINALPAALLRRAFSGEL